MRLGRGTRRLGSALLLRARARLGAPSLAFAGPWASPRPGVRRFIPGARRSRPLVGMRRGVMSSGLRRDWISIGQRLRWRRAGLWRRRRSTGLRCRRWNAGLRPSGTSFSGRAVETSRRGRLVLPARACLRGRGARLRRRRRRHAERRGRRRSQERRREDERRDDEDTREDDGYPFGEPLPFPMAAHAEPPAARRKDAARTDGHPRGRYGRPPPPWPHPWSLELPACIRAQARVHSPTRGPGAAFQRPARVQRGALPGT
jgi:hypothetical protein